MSTEKYSVTARGLGTYAPKSYRQDDLLHLCGLAGSPFARDVCQSGRIEARSFCEPPGAMTQDASTSTRLHYLRRHAPELGAQAVSRACGDELLPEQLDAVIVANSSGFMLPGLAEVMGEEYGVGSRRALRFNLIGQGCYAALPAMVLAQQLVSGGRVDSAAVICTETSSCVFPQRPSERSALLVPLLFGEGAASLVFTRDAGPKPVKQGSSLPEFLDWEAELGHGTLNGLTLGHEQSWTANVGVDVPNAGKSLLPGVVRRLLQRASMTPRDIQHWIIHPGGKRVLENCQTALELPADALGPSFEVLRRYGNMMSAAVLFTLEETLRARRPGANEFGIMVGIGPGMTVIAMLLRWT